VAVAIAGAALLEFLFHLPRAPISLFVGIGGSRMTVATLAATERQIEEHGLSGLLGLLLRRRV
jgi:hypothetical protein